MRNCAARGEPWLRGLSELPEQPIGRRRCRGGNQRCGKALRTSCRPTWRSRATSSRLFEAVDDVCGRIAALVNNAGMLETQMRVDEMDAGRLTRVFGQRHRSHAVLPRSGQADVHPLRRCRRRHREPVVSGRSTRFARRVRGLCRGKGGD